MPSLISLSYGIFCLSRLSFTFFRSVFTLRTSSSDVTSGIIILTLPNALALNIALSCVVKTSTLPRQNLIARYPRNGLVSFASPIYGIFLSPPTSSVLIVSVFPFKTIAAFLYASNCFSSSGIETPFINRNSVLNSPTPSAPLFIPFTASSSFPILAARHTLYPSDVTVSLSIYFFNSFTFF